MLQSLGGHLHLLDMINTKQTKHIQTDRTGPWVVLTGSKAAGWGGTYRK